MQSSPAYTVSDNASTINKAIRGKGYPHLRDAGHTFGLFLQHVYENEEDFQRFMKEVNGVKFREIMRPAAYLLPPKQRTTARFMNLSGTAARAFAMLRSFACLTAEEQEIFGFIQERASIINEIHEVFCAVNPLLQGLKNEGISGSVVRSSLLKVKPLLTSPCKRISAVGRLTEAYIKEEYGKLPDKNKRWHISSDIIESLFGSYKGRKSPDAMNGVTKQLFFLPALTRMSGDAKIDTGCFKHYLEQVFLKDLDLRRCNHLSENRTVKRKKIFRA
jgi:hypothetical protein